MEKLKSLLDYHDNLYYKGIPEISDSEYDALKKEYLSIIDEEEYDYVPTEILIDSKRVRHSHPIQSLAKVNNLNNLKEELIRLAPFVIQPKIDGLTVIRYPENLNRGVTFVTRGNGEFGEDITSTVLKINGIGKVKNVDYAVRMEAFMSKTVFNELNKERISNGEEPFKNPRNAAAGMLRLKDPNKVKGIDYLAYNIIGSELRETRQLFTLQQDGFSIPFVNKTFLSGEIDQAIEYILNFDKDSLDYEIDGLVIKSNTENSLGVFGFTGHHPKNAIAYKFEDTGVWSKLVDITWQIGRTGKITPVAIIEPTDIDGSTISKITLHNFSIMTSLGIAQGCEVFVIKANGVIPAIIDSRLNNGKKFLPPTKCWECNSDLELIGDQFFCINPDCADKLVKRIMHIARREALDITGLSEETAIKLANSGVKNPFHIFDLTEEDLKKLPGFAEKSAKNLYNAIQASRNVELKNFLYAAGIPLIGRAACKDIANYFGSIEKIFLDHDHDWKEMESIKGIGQNSIQALNENIHIWKELLTYVIPKESNSKSEELKVFSFVITGTFEIPRKQIEEIIIHSGHNISNSLSKKVDYVLAGKEAGSKEAKAKKLGIKIINSLDELRDLL